MPSFVIPGVKSLNPTPTNRRDTANSNSLNCFSQCDPNSFLGSKSLYNVVILCWKGVSALCALDWLLFKVMFNVAVGMYNFLRNFLTIVKNKEEVITHNGPLNNMLRLNRIYYYIIALI